MKTKASPRALLGQAGAVLGWGARAILGVVLATLVYQTFVGLPSLLYHRRAPSLRQECMGIRPGMKLTEVLAMVDVEAEPMEQMYGNDHFAFRRQDLQCVAHFEEGGDRVVSVEIVHPEITFEPEDF
ncbi:MAG: hypothetical protein L0212_04480 [Acidobacteria bacterium]|nr:hypothetical protein [Acidobacteriota bacterium]